MKILKPFTGTGAVFFPYGRPPEGTCEHATDLCIENCYQLNPKHPSFDEEIRIPEQYKRLVYECFLITPIELLYKQIAEDLQGLQTPILHWFGSGDCLTKDLDRICAIIDRVNEDENIVQMGFTRNVALWNRHKNIFALTIDNQEEATENAIYSIPNYEAEVSIMYNPFYQVRGGLCGPVTCNDLIDSKLDHYINCRSCRRLETGCFDRRNTKE